MKKLMVVLIVLVVLLFVAMPVMAKDGNNVADNIGNLITGKGNSYLGAVVMKDFELPNTFLGVDKLGVEGWFDAEMGDYKGEEREYIGGLRLRVTL